MATIYYEKDVKAGVLKGKRIAVIGWGSQGHAHALNLRDSGFTVMTGLRKGSGHWNEARDSGLEVLPIAEAVASADLVMVLIPDEVQGNVFKSEIAPGLRSGQMLLFAHGFSIHFSQIQPPADIDVAMIAPKGPGTLVRREYLAGRGVPGLIAIHQDHSGHARDLALAYASGIGCIRAGVIATTFQEEAETDLFGEQAVLCGGVTSLMKAGYETLVEAGYQPEMAYFECINEMKLIVDLIYEGGFTHMRQVVSNTAEYGDYRTQGKLVDASVRKTMKEMLDDIRSGRFAREWILENQAGKPSFTACKRTEREHPLEKIGRELRAMMPWLHPEGKSDGKPPKR